MTNEQEQKPSRKTFFRKGNARMRQAADSAFQLGYLISYVTGVQTQRWLRFFGRQLIRPVKAAGRAAYKAADFLVLRHLRSVRCEARRFAGGFALAGARVRTARERGRLVAALTVLALPFLAIKRHRRALACVGNLLMPAAAALVLMVTVQYWSSLSFGLELEYEGESFGCISDESVFDNAAAMVNARVCETDTDETLQVRTPKLTLTVVSKADVLDEATLCDKIIRTSGDEFAEATGLYIDGTLIGTMPSEQDVNVLLEERLAAQRTDGRTAEFVQAVTTQSGLYPISTMVSEEGMRRLLDVEKEAAQFYTVQAGDTISGIAAAHSMTVSEVQTLNALENTAQIYAGQQLQLRTAVRRLQVRTTAVSSYDEVMVHTTRTEYDATAYEGTRTVKVKGQDGARNVTVQTVAVDGVVQSTTVLSAVTTVEPVEEVVVIGTKKRSTQSAYTSGVDVVDGDGVVTGSMLWPVPAVHSMSQRYHGGHSGIDIANGPVSMMNQPVVAADGGTVTVVNTNPNVGYGIYVIVDHGNGLTTLYSHLNSVSVVAGQPVSRGQEIARAGNTGWSTGPHLHFEVRVNGRCVNPLDYVS